MHLILSILRRFEFYRFVRPVVFCGLLASLCVPGYAEETKEIDNQRYFVEVAASTKEERSAIANTGASIETVYSDKVFTIASGSILAELKQHFNVQSVSVLEDLTSTLDFPGRDSSFHNYDEVLREIDAIVAVNPNLARKFSIGKSLQGRDLVAIHLNSSPEALVRRIELGRAYSLKPGIVFLGNHHAREHLSAEVPLKLADYLVRAYGRDAQITALLNSRDVYIIPMVNPDGVEFDIVDGRYKSHRKNMRPTSSSGGFGRASSGVDLNRNYGFQWGTGGSSRNPSSETYMGEAPFSEPETLAVKNFVDSKPNLKVLLSFHTFSELILYPWGHKHAPIDNETDRRTYETLATQMASWNGYKPEQSSDLYIASGDTTDWAWGVHGIFSFTFELSPKDMYSGGFYPGQSVIDPVFQANLRPCLYLIEVADNPRKVLQ